ncbi:MAG TPA: ATP-binding cassette domain-containing protein [Planctomycetota bacterium]|jgi:ABC-2 type transport system ATP-binding protein|nr:ATP-binding cassette domain-containing protein [Planctomycetota bacterium]OQC20359.1 MAG: putative ABC transporter ATP-binding protein YbhF [Planctomycetes bacterium ADurb.Bin069]NMD35403.1 ATP-binding cassette domain-containing protein [Planctomycetota bacterium]HNR98656.1 ATP-binding cassette domain-containing protein [Planctomycetota bacterium]HNU25036.1 ATP-binding cassette domain-containing protein [Planctomycetota bacterium]
MIEVEGLRKRYGRAVALDGISFRVNAGEVAGFVGLNGAGKTTAMRILCGFMPRDAGAVTVGGIDVGKDSLGARRLLGYLPEGVPLYPEMRVEEFLRYRAGLKGLGGARARGAVARVLASCDIADVSRRIVGQLSKGYRQRVGIADALLVDPPYLVLDEPTVGLDPLQVRRLRDLLKTIGASRTIIFSTHILAEVEVVCDTVIVIHRGRIIARGRIPDLIARAAAGTSRPATLEEAFVALVRDAEARDVA